MKIAAIAKNKKIKVNLNPSRKLKVTLVPGLVFQKFLVVFVIAMVSFSSLKFLIFAK